MLYFIIFFVVDFSLGRTPPDPRRAEERWLDQCRLYAGTWQRSWTGIWLSAKSPWTAAVRRSGWCLSEWCRWSFLQKRRTPDTTAPKTTARGGDIWECSLWKTRYHLKSLRHRPWWANMQTSLRYAEVTHTSQNVYVTTESFTSRRSVQKWPASIMWCLRAFSVLLEELVAQQGMSLQCFFFVSFCLKLKSSCNPKGKMPHWKCL